MSNISVFKKPEWFFYPVWVLLTTLSIPLALSLNSVIIRIIISFVGDFIYVDGVRHITEDYLFLYTFVLIVSLITGLLQYGLLRQYLPHMGWWVLATLAGWLTGPLFILISDRLNFWTNEPVELIFIYFLIGLSTGVSQWLLLSLHLPQAGWWVGATLIGWILLGLITGNSLDQFELMALGFLPACVTAGALAYLFNQVQGSEMQIK